MLPAAGRVHEPRVTVRRRHARLAAAAEAVARRLVIGPLCHGECVVCPVGKREVVPRPPVGEVHLLEADPEHLLSKLLHSHVPLRLVAERPHVAAPFLAALLRGRVVRRLHRRREAASVEPLYTAPVLEGVEDVKPSVRHRVRAADPCKDVVAVSDVGPVHTLIVDHNSCHVAPGVAGRPGRVTDLGAVHPLERVFRSHTHQADVALREFALLTGDGCLLR